jgi:hypothetical protein
MRTIFSSRLNSKIRLFIGDVVVHRGIIDDTDAAILSSDIKKFNLCIDSDFQVFYAWSHVQDYTIGPEEACRIAGEV